MCARRHKFIELRRIRCGLHSSVQPMISSRYDGIRSTTMYARGTLIIALACNCVCVCDGFGHRNGITLNIRNELFHILLSLRYANAGNESEISSERIDSDTQQPSEVHAPAKRNTEFQMWQNGARKCTHMYEIIGQMKIFPYAICN